MAALQAGPLRLEFGRRTYLMGILNVTPDSFSGDGVMDVDAAVARGRALLADGADILDVGGESTRPGAEPVPLEAELTRVIPVVERLVADLGAAVSVDTRKAAVARRALRVGAAMINDVSGLRADPDMAGVVAEARVPVVLMHWGTRHAREDPADGGIIAEVRAFLAERIAAAVAAGIARDRILVDPGFGYGKTVEQNLALLRGLRELRALGRPLVISTSRKGTIGKVLGDLPVEDRLEGTAATVAVAIVNGVDIVRVHDVRAMARVARMTDAIVRDVEDPAHTRGGHPPAGSAGTARAYLGLGSNLGDRRARLEAARARLSARPGVRILRASSIYETEPVGMINQPWFLNQVLEIETTLDPHALLAAAQKVEASLGRTREARWGPRTIDIDLLLYGDAALASERLRLPHPELAHRRFVLLPLAELVPRLRLPDGRAVADLLRDLGETPVVRRA